MQQKNCRYEYKQTGLHGKQNFAWCAFDGYSTYKVWKYFFIWRRIEGWRGKKKTRKKDLIETIAKVVYAEARGESFTGQVAVAATIMNRLESEEFPNELTKVLEHYTPRYKEVTTEMLEQNPSCLKAAEKAYNGEDPLAEFLGGPTLFFYNPEKSDEDEVEARKDIEITTRVGNHVFYSKW